MDMWSRIRAWWQAPQRQGLRTTVAILGFASGVPVLVSWLLSAVAVVAFVATLADEKLWVAILVLAVVWAALQGGLYFYRLRKPLAPTTQPALGPTARSALVLESDQHELNHLVSVLAKYANEHTRAEITFYSPETYGIAQDLASAFASANWAVNSMINTPQPINDHFKEGIEVRGPLPHLVKAIALGLINSGFTKAHSVVEATAIQPNNPKHQGALHTVRVAIGFGN